MLNFAQTPIYKVSGFRPEYKAILSRAASLGVAAPSLTWQIKGNAMVDRLIRDGVWSHVDLFMPFYTDGSSGFSLINWINPTASTPAAVGTPTFTSLDGWSSNGAASGPYIDTDYTESIDAVHWQLNNCSFFIQVKESGQESSYICGAQNGTNPMTRFRPRNTSDQAGFRIDNTNNEVQFSNTDASGFWHIKRNGTAVSVYRNGSSVFSGTNTGDVSVTTVSHNVGRSNVSGAVTSVKTVRCYGAGDNMAGLESKLYNAFNDYMN